MSKNLVELVRRHHAVQAPTALEVLKAGGRRARRADRRRSPARPPRCPVSPRRPCTASRRSTTICSSPRGERHVRVCTGTACFAATGGRHVDELARAARPRPRRARRTTDRSRLPRPSASASATPRPRSATATTIDAGPDVVDRVLAGDDSRGRRARVAERAGRAGADPARRLVGPPRALSELSPEELLAEVKEANVRGRGGAGFPAGQKWQFTRAAPGEQKFIVANGDEGDPGSYIDKYLMEQAPALVLEGMALAGYAVGAAHGFVLTPLGVPALEARAGSSVAAARAAGLLGEDILRQRLLASTSRSSRAPAPTWSARRPRCSPASRAARHGLRPAAVPRRARPLRHADRRQQHRDARATSRSSRAPARRPTRRSRPARRRARSSSASTSGSRDPDVYEVRFGTTIRELCEDVAGGPARRPTIKALQIGGPLGGILPASKLDTPFDFDALAAEGCMVGHGGILALRRPTDMRGGRQPPAPLRRARVLRQVLPVPDRPAARLRDVQRRRPVDRARLEALLEALELGSPLRPRRRHARPDPQPARALPRRTRAQLMQVTIDGDSSSRSSRAARRCLEADRALAGAERSDALLRRPPGPFGACRVCLVKAEGAPSPIPACTTPVPRRDGDRHARRDRPPGRHARSSSSCSPSCRSRPHPTPSSPRSRAARASASRAGPGATHAVKHDERHPYLAFQHELCISCGRCVRACDEVQGAFALTATGRGFSANITAGLDAGFKDSTCVSCGACADTARPTRSRR